MLRAAISPPPISGPSPQARVTSGPWDSQGCKVEAGSLCRPGVTQEW